MRWITFDRSADGLHYFVMEYLDGEELEKVLRREGKLAPKRVAAILLQVLGALRRAHAQGKHGSLLHLDLKPENVFVMPSVAPGEPERVKVIDFGIGQHVGAEVRAAEHPELHSIYDLPPEDLDKSIGSLALPEDDEGPVETESALVPARLRVQRARGGTLLYASPEQCKHLAGHKDIEPLDGRSDLYSLGVMGFRMLTGQYPFVRNATAFEAIENHLKAPPRKVGTLGIRIPRELAAFVDRCLVKERERRWKDAQEAYAALERIVHPRLSPVKVAVPIALVAVLGLGALYYTREPVVNALTLVDPAIESVSERVVSELHLGPQSPARIVRLESDSVWERDHPPRLRLTDATSGKPLAGWSARWSDVALGTLEISSLPEARSAAAVVELGGGRSRWRSARLALNYLGSWRIESVSVAGRASTKPLDPRQRFFELTVSGDPAGRAALASIEVFQGATSLGRTGVSPRAQGELVRYAAGGLDALFTGQAHALELRLVARDRAGQEETSPLSLSLAGEAPDFGPETGFVAAPGSAPLPMGEDQVLLPGNALAVLANCRARARFFLEPAGEPVFVAEIPEAGAPLFVSLAELGILGSDELPGTLRIELDDAPWVERATSSVRVQRLSFRFTPVAPGIQAQLVARGLEQELLEEREPGSANHVNPGDEARLLVRTPPGTNLWLEARCEREGTERSAPVRMSRAGGPFELSLSFPREGTYRIHVTKHVLLAGGERGPLIPPEHDYRVEVDRTPPALELALEGADSVAELSEPLFRGAFAQRVGVRLSESSALAELSWVLRLPDGTRREGLLDVEARAAEDSLELPALREHQQAEGRYELELVARDRAGNTGRTGCAWQVARSGPTLALEAPLASGEGRWILGSGRAWNVQVRASDANGVAGVRARIVREGQSGPELELVSGAGNLWELREPERPSAFPWWTGKELLLELVARDRAGLETRQSLRGLVPELERPDALVVAPKGSPASGVMVEVDVPGDFVFGGRSGEGRRPWNVAIPRAVLRPFFLDAREVSRGEFLRFLRTADGYADARWWPPGVAPDPSRSAGLARALAGDEQRAATGIAWSEACAYAAWCGKRLPTLVEWEFAVRGPGYREAPASAALPGVPPSWPANLCAGVREFTATAERLTAEALDFASQCRLHPERLSAREAPYTAELGRADGAAPAAPELGASHWIAGAGPGESPSWSAKGLRADAGGYEDVGFRCALGREAVHARLDRGEYLLVE